MRTIKTKSGVVVKIYSSARDLPIGRYTEFQKYLLSQSVIGSDTDSITSKLSRISAFVENGKQKEAIEEIELLKSSVLSLQSGVPYLSMAFAVLVAEIGGQVAQDTTLEGLQMVVAQLSELDFTYAEIEDEIDNLKKKS